MKKLFSFVLFFICFFVGYIDVFAKEYEALELIPISESASVDTEHFTYDGISFSTVNGDFNIISAKNKTKKENYLTISILLFDNDSKNIGLISYCSRKDLDGQYSQVKVNPGALSPMEFNTKDRYLVGNRTYYDVYYYAVLDDNYDCRSISENKYEGLTIDEIMNGKVSSNYVDSSWINNFFRKYNIKDFLGYIIALIVTHLVLSILFAIFNTMITGKGNILAFIPIINLFFGFKLALGIVYTILYSILVIIALLMFIFKSNFILLIVIGVIYVIALIICIYKMITTNYRKFYLEDKLLKLFKKKPKVDENDAGNIQLDLSYSDKSTDGLDMVLDVNQGLDNGNNEVEDNSQVNSQPTDSGNSVIDLNFGDKKDDNEDNPWGF